MIGTDIVYIPRFENQPELAKKVLSKHEHEIYQSLSDKRKTEFLAGRFAAKEALSKATGYGIGTEKSIILKDISILPDENGAPIVKGISAHISISHDKDYAIAVALLQTPTK